MSDLVAFLNARLDEDEAAAKDALEVEADAGEFWPNVFEAYNEGCLNKEQANHIARHDPARVLREVEAKRKRLTLMAEATAEMDRLLADDHAGRADQAMAVGRARAATVAVKYDAAVYQDHPDYRQEWV